jgi:ubiquinone/menaquinone biosynthesis C-methylase UbiE
MDYVIEQLSDGDGPIVDLASGRCYLVEKMLQSLKRSVVATDFSPGILRKSRRKLKHFDLDDRVSMLSFDARRTPFKDGVVGTLTTNLGLPNIEEPGNLLKELRRISAGNLFAISHFFPEDDEANRKVIRDAGLDMLLYCQAALEQFTVSGWNVEVKNACVGEACPTPASVVLEGARPDGLPVEDTMLEWCVLSGS